MLGAPFIWRPWGELYEAVVTGRPAFERIFGSNLFDHLAAHPDDSSIFDAAMSSHSTMISTILAAYDFSRFDRIVDVGGGRGELLLGILSAYSKDRKSTRLNSSHLGISYAVFCLKKKTCAPQCTRSTSSRTATHTSNSTPPNNSTI